jgi:predicted acylesterase/phospholipase RssA
MNGAASTAPDLRAQLRLGVVMTGGVSLAIWMGGVTLELDRLRRDVAGTVYCELCQLAGVRPVVDIVSGTSAGGLNGTLLAAATAWTSNLEDLRGVWLSAADMAALLRPAGAASPPSLLDGDGYFLAQARQAIGDLRRKGTTPTDTGAARQREGLPPVHLTVTSTLMQGNDVNFTDSLGSAVNSTTYLGLYAFSTDASTGGAPAAFDQPAVVDQLARAARSSASFPMAFEASRIDTGGGAVDMASVADFVNAGDRPATRYVLDGGLTANEPMDQVYDLIRDQPSTGPVRRVLCYVSPLAGAEEPQQPPAFGSDPPDLLKVMDATLFIPREQNIVRQLRTILDRADDYRAISQARRALTIDPNNAPDLLRAADVLRPVIDAQRGQLALAGRIVAGAKGPADAAAVEAAGDREARRQALLLVQDLLRRAISSAGDGEFAALAQQREAVSMALTIDLDRDDEARRVVASAYDVLTTIVPSIVAQVNASPAPDAPIVQLSKDLEGLQALVGAAEATGANGAEAPWRALRALDILFTATSSSLAPNPQRIDLIQFSANAPNCFDGRSTPAVKLTGVQFNHFGAFYRGGWRANDWMWGRLDGAVRVVELLVDPDALLATGTPVADLAARLYEIAVGPSTSPDRQWLAQQPELVGGAAEIETLLSAVAASPPAEHRAAALNARRLIGRMVAARVQLQILRDELRQVRTQVAADREAGAAATGADTVFLEAAKQLGDGASAETIVDVFQNCQVALDRLKDELGSDRMTTLSTQALAVATGAIDEVAKERGFGGVRPILGLVRWTLRLANALTSTGFRGSQLVKVAIPTLAVLAAALMALAVWDDRSGLLRLVLGLVLAGVAVAAIVTNADSARMVFAALVDIVVLVAGFFLIDADWSAAPFVGTTLSVLAAAVLAALVLRRPRIKAVKPAATVNAR